MEKYPEIYQSLFGDSENHEFTRRDACINSDLIRCACDFLNVICIPAGESEDYESFTAGVPWRICIEDEHDSESSPHYVLDIGENTEKVSPDDWTTIQVRYCDNYSTDERVIEQSPGYFIVHAYIEHDPVRAKELAKKICEAYEESLRKHFPDYYIICRKIVE